MELPRFEGPLIFPEISAMLPHICIAGSYDLIKSTRGVHRSLAKQDKT
jgi:hypothetical protein